MRRTQTDECCQMVIRFNFYRHTWSDRRREMRRSFRLYWLTQYQESRPQTCKEYMAVKLPEKNTDIGKTSASQFGCTNNSSSAVWFVKRLTQTSFWKTQSKAGAPKLKPKIAPRKDCSGDSIRGKVISKEKSKKRGIWSQAMFSKRKVCWAKRKWLGSSSEMKGSNEQQTHYLEHWWLSNRYPFY